MRILCGAQTDQGKIRASNEDSFIADPRTGVFVVADGMGGHAAGEIASRIAADTVNEVLSGRREDSGMEEVLHQAVGAANRRVHETQKVQAGCRGMGSTLTVLTFSGERYYVAQVGDSRAYLMRDGNLVQLTHDHSLVWPLYTSGIITKEDICKNPRKNVITRSIGTQPEVEADLYSGDARPGDIYLLCSDGLTDVLTDADISRILSNGEPDPARLARVLVDAANAGGGPDNITAVIASLAPDSD